LLRGKLPDMILDRRDKTFFDDHIMSQVDYPTLRQFLVAPNHHINGVDYQRLAAHIEREDFNLIEWYWAKDLARIHAFLSLW
jgi:asparagine synthase (glutamine-hydrolysing)